MVWSFQLIRNQNHFGQRKLEKKNTVRTQKSIHSKLLVEVKIIKNVVQVPKLRLQLMRIYLGFMANYSSNLKTWLLIHLDFSVKLFVFNFRNFAISKSTIDAFLFILYFYSIFYTIVFKYIIIHVVIFFIISEPYSHSLTND
jgi:hypothetical protein